MMVSVDKKTRTCNKFILCGQKTDIFEFGSAWIIVNLCRKCLALSVAGFGTSTAICGRGLDPFLGSIRSLFKTLQKQCSYGMEEARLFAVIKLP
jgi:hypothetical protein